MLIVLNADNRTCYYGSSNKSRNRSIIIQIIIADVLEVLRTRNHVDAIADAVDYATGTNECTTVIKIIKSRWVIVLINRFGYLEITPPTVPATAGAAKNMAAMKRAFLENVLNNIINTALYKISNISSKPSITLARV